MNTVNLAQWQLVKVSNGGELKERIYLTETEDGKYICVHQNDVEEYENGNHFRVGIWTVLETEPVELYNFEYGEEILVSNGGNTFSRRKFLWTVWNQILAVHNWASENFENGSTNFRAALWNMAKKAPEQLTREEAEARLWDVEIID